jgi:hypothetical protein
MLSLKKLKCLNCKSENSFKSRPFDKELLACKCGFPICLECKGKFHLPLQCEDLLVWNQIVTLHKEYIMMNAMGDNEFLDHLLSNLQEIDTIFKFYWIFLFHQKKNDNNLNMPVETFENLMRSEWIFEFIKNALIFNFLKGGSAFLNFHIVDLKKGIADLLKEDNDMIKIYNKFQHIEKNAFSILSSLLKRETYIFDGSLYI